MCFRPAEEGGDEVIYCTNCGKKINRVAGELASKCPFCKTPTEGMEDHQDEVPTPGMAQPQAPGAPAPAPGAPVPPPAAPGAAAPQVPQFSRPGAAAPQVPQFSRPGQD